MNYQNGKIYTIRSYQTDKYYIGSTASTLTKRLSGHKKSSNKSTSKIITDLGDAYIELLELYPCNSKIELMKREGELQRLYKNDIVNRKIECRTIKEYYKDNADKIKTNVQEYYKNNVNIIKEYKQEYYEKNADIILENKKQYYKSNADKIQEKQKQSRKNNAEKTKAQDKKYNEARKLKLKTII
jgi:hypothetical protein